MLSKIVKGLKLTRLRKDQKSTDPDLSPVEAIMLKEREKRITTVEYYSQFFKVGFDIAEDKIATLRESLAKQDNTGITQLYSEKIALENKADAINISVQLDSKPTNDAFFEITVVVIPSAIPECEDVFVNYLEDRFPAIKSDPGEISTFTFTRSQSDPRVITGVTLIKRHWLKEK